MNLKSSVIKEYLKSQNIKKDNLMENFDLIIDGANIQKRYYKEEISKIQEDLIVLLENNIYSLTLKNINIEESKTMDYIMKKIGENVKDFKIENSYIGNLDLYISTISERKGKNYSLSEKQHIQDFEYNKQNGMLVISAENLDILSEINRYKKTKILKIKVYSKEELNNIIKYIDSIKALNANVILVDKSKEKIREIYNYENYVNGKLVIFQSNLIKESLGLDKLPTKKVNQTMYKLQIDGSKVGGEPIYVLEGEEEELFIKDMQEIAKYINIAKTEYRNVIFPNTYEIKEVLSEVESKSLNIKEEIEEESTFVVKRSLFDIIKEKICKLFNINIAVNKNQKAFPVNDEKS